MAEQAAREDVYVEPRRFVAVAASGFATTNAKPTVGVGAAPAPAAADRVPDLDHPVVHRRAVAVEQLPVQLERALGAGLDQRGCLRCRQSPIS